MSSYPPKTKIPRRHWPLSSSRAAVADDLRGFHGHLAQTGLLPNQWSTFLRIKLLWTHSCTFRFHPRRIQQILVSIIRQTADSDACAINFARPSTPRRVSSILGRVSRGSKAAMCKVIKHSKINSKTFGTKSHLAKPMVKRTTRLSRPDSVFRILPFDPYPLPWPAEVKRSEVKRSEVKRSELKWTGVNWSDMNWNKLIWSEPKWTEVNWCGLNWCKLSWSDELKWIALKREEKEEDAYKKTFTKMVGTNAWVGETIEKVNTWAGPVETRSLWNAWKPLIVHCLIKWLF